MSSRQAKAEYSDAVNLCDSSFASSNEKTLDTYNRKVYVTNRRGGSPVTVAHNRMNSTSLKDTHIKYKYYCLAKFQILELAWL